MVRKARCAVALSAAIAVAPLLASPSVIVGGVIGVAALTWPDEARAASNAYTADELRSVESENEARVREIREQEITQLRITLNRRIPGNRRADLYFRMAEIHLEAYRATFLLEGRVHEKRLQKGISDRLIDRSNSRPHLGKGIAACEEILRTGVAYPKMDEVYYFLAYNHGELEHEKESLRFFRQIAERFPQSPYAAEAWREIGDAAYRKHDYRTANQNFDRAIRKLRESKDEAAANALPRILHKQAWTFYRLKQFDRAIATMKEAVSAGAGEKFLSVREEALRDMAVFMTESGQVEQALAYFREVGGDKNYYPKVLERLGRQYERNVEAEKAVTVYESLLKTNPEDEAAFRVRVKLVDLDLRRGRLREALGRLKGAKLFWEGEPDTVTASQNLRAMIRRTATEKHENFRKTGNRASLMVAEDFYSGYLSLVLSKEDPRRESPEIRMYLADVKRELGKAKEASELYRQVLESGDKRYAKEAGGLWVASLSEAIKRAGAAGGVKSPEPSAVEREFVDAADRMEDALGDAPEAREVQLRAAQVLAGYPKGQSEAIKRCRKLMERWPKSPQALTSARLWIQILADRLPQGTSAAIEDSDAGSDMKKAIRVIRESSELMAADASAGGKLKAALQDQETRLKVGVIASLEKEKDFAGAAKGYESFAAETARRELAEKAYANAVSSYLKASDLEGVERVSAAWLKRYPDSGKIVESVRNAATVALITGKFDFAVSLFEKLGATGKDPESLETAARVAEGNGDSARARKLYDRYLEVYRTSLRRFWIALQLAQDLEKSKQDSAAAGFYKFALSGPPEIEAESAARLADLYLRGSDVENGRKMLAQAARGGAKGVSSPFVGYARFRQTELSEREARFPPLKLPESELRKGLAARLQFLEPLSRGYAKAVEAGGPWGVAALDRLAAWAFRFADEVDAIVPPGSASPEAIKNFRASLKQVSDPLRKKAIETWAEAYRKATDNELLSPVAPGIADRLAEAKRDGVFRAQGYRGRLRLAGLPADGGPEGKSDALNRIREKLTASPQDVPAWIDYGNLLWGQGKPSLSRLAYDRALALNPKSVAALNNRAVVLVSGSGQEDWAKALEANQIWREALRFDEFFVAAKMNRASHLNYYRLFSKARPLWEQVVAKVGAADAQAGYAIALQGLGDAAGAKRAMAKAEEQGSLGSSGFVKLYHEAARAPGPEKCLSALEDVRSDELQGFEKQSWENLRKTCASAKK